MNKDYSKCKTLDELTHAIFDRPKEIRAEMDSLLARMKCCEQNTRLSGGTPYEFDLRVMEFLELMLEYEDHRLAI